MDSGPGKFISEEIAVTRDDKTGYPTAFRWDGREYLVREIIAVWPDWGFSEGAPRRKNWRMRRHRNCYRIETTEGAVFDLYHDRGTKSGSDVWILQTQLT